MAAPYPPDPEHRDDSGAAGRPRTPEPGDTLRDDDLPQRRQEIRAMAAVFGLLE